MMASASVATASSRQVPPIPSFATRVTQPQPLIFAADERERERTQLFAEFLDSQQCSTDGLEYKEKIRLMVQRNETRLLVNIGDVRHYNDALSRGLMTSPLEYMPSFEAALRQAALLAVELATTSIDPKVAFHLGLEGAFGEFAVDPRGLTAEMLSQMVAVEGIITSCFQVRPRLVRSVHYNETKHSFISREYRDNLFGGPTVPSSTGSSYPTQDGEGNLLTTEYGLCSYRDYQKVTLQEMPERAPPGQLPRSVDIVLSDDLVDVVKPGDRVQVVGINRAIGSIYQGNAPAFFKHAIIANAIRPIQSMGNHAQLILTDVDIEAIKGLSRRPDLFSLLAQSLAPSIWGHTSIKKALLLMLLGGVEKNVDATHIRGDINILLVGDPSTAKSQLLRVIMATAPLAIATTGRGSSGVGLTAAVVSDQETGDRRLEAGAMVLADRGIVCIDEFDKMSDQDRVAIHEVMEQQTVTIAKAGIHLSLNARCSVLAAANPVYAQYREQLSPRENIRLPDSLLSRFDLLFIVLDRISERNDRMLSRHVLSLHASVTPDNHHSAMESAVDEGEPCPKVETVPIDLVRRYIHYAKLRIRPVLTSQSIEAIKAMYLAFRAKHSEEASEKTLPVTPRTLETLIRLATAHAKMRLSATIEEQDALAAEELVRFSLYKEVIRAPRRSKRTKDTDATDAELVSHEKNALPEAADAFSFTEAPPSGISSSGVEIINEPSTGESPEVPSAEQELAIKRALLRIRTRNDAFIMVDALISELAADDISLPMGTLTAVLQRMEQANQLMFRDGIIFFI